MTKKIANILTGSRILGSFVLLFLPVFKSAFYVTYLLCGFSDMIDGTIARKTNSASEFGSRLDTAADITFIAVSLIKFIPILQMPLWLWIWCGAIAIIKISNMIWGYVAKKELLALHTKLNKATGLVLFLLPLTLPFAELKYSAIVVCFIGTVSAIQEGFYIRKDTGKQC